MSMISDLPDQMLIEILSWLPTRQVVATMLLSRRWEFLWKQVPKFDHDFRQNDGKYFSDFVDIFLQLHEGHVFRSFKLSVSPCCGTRKLKRLFQIDDMECNKDEAKRVMGVAEKKLSENDYVGAKKFATKAQNLYPHLDGLNQVSMMIHVYISEANGGKESDLYGVLGAEGAFKLVSNAWSVLSDKTKRSAYDQRRKLRAGMQKPPAPSQHNDPAASSNVNQNAKARSEPQRPTHAPKPASSSSANQSSSGDGVNPPSANTRSNKPASGPHKPASSSNKAAPGPTPVDSSKEKKQRMFWTMCEGCNTGNECWRDLYLNKTIYCQNCGQAYIATEQNPWDRYVTYLSIALPISLQQWSSAQNQARKENTNGASSSSSGTSSSSFVRDMTQLSYTVSLLEEQQAQWTAQNQAANNGASPSGTTNSSSFPYIGATPQEKFCFAASILVVFFSSKATTTMECAKNKWWY
ncbi:hypothetical protein Bca101_023478 [Brassica carinata]